MKSCFRQLHFPEHLAGVDIIRCHQPPVLSRGSLACQSGNRVSSCCCCCCCCSPGNRTRPGPRSRHDGATCSLSTHFRSHCVTLRGSEHSELTELASKQWLKPCLPSVKLWNSILYYIIHNIIIVFSNSSSSTLVKTCILQAQVVFECVRVSTDDEDDDAVLYHCRREREQPSWTSWRRWSWRSSSSGRGREPSSRMPPPVQERVQSECLTPLRALCDVI